LRRRILLVALATTTIALTAPTAHAVTVGAPLNLPANTAEGCEKVVLPPLRPSLALQGLLPSTCTFFGLDSAGRWTSQTPPGRWVIDQARVRTGPRVGPMVFTALRALRSKAGTQGIACCTAVAESQVFVPQPNAVNTIPVNMPVVNTVELIDNEQVEVVDYLGITLLTPGSSVPVHIAAGPADGASAVGSYFAPALRNGQTGAGPGTFTSEVLLVNAEYQPAGSGPLPPTPIAPVNPFALLPGVDLLGRGTRARLGATVPGAGLLRAASPARARIASPTGSAATASAAAKRKAKRRAAPPKRKLLSTAKLRVERAGTASITVRLSRWGRKLLAKRGRLRLPVKLTFTPVGGSPSVQSTRVTFKKRPAGKRKAAKRRAAKRKAAKGD
jgi:hypothetical protein